MDKQQRQQWNRMVKKLCREIAKEFGFSMYKSTFLVKVENDIAQIICFDFPPMGMRLHICVQPLYVESSCLHIGFGCDIKKKDWQTVGKWGSVPDRMEEDISELYSTIVQTVFPLFSSLNSPSKLAQFIPSDKSKIFFPFPPAIRYPYLAFSLMRTGAYEAALPALKMYINDCSQYSFPSVQEDIADTQKIIELIHARKYDEIDTMLDQNVATLRARCGI